ncbi:TY5A [Symbiodinium sp. CCMP2592]|nr:TY5A [Symbiodinium sp. CCMP2592]
MAQLQAVMLQQLSNEKDRSGEKSPETVKPGVSTLPLLPQVSSSTASVDVMDWLELIAAPMSDLSDGSGEWWTLVKKEASKAYQLWTNASPIEKLRIMPPQVAELETGRWSRVNSRASSMILLALHDSVRQEMVSRRSTGSATALLFRLLTIYQPGGQQEKVTILQNLQQPGEEKDPHQAVAALRAWARWLRRCRDLGVSAPDPSLLARGLTSMTRSVLERDQEVSFRTSLVRSNLLVDTKPSYDSVDQYYHHLLAECEAMAVSSQTSGTTSTSTPNKPDPKIKPMKPEPKGGPPQPPPAPPSTSRTTTGGQGGEEEVDKRGQVPCRYFGKSFKGCARGTKCPFKHSWEGNEKEKAVRCHLCGGKHMAKECPTKKPSTPSSTSSATPAGTPKAAPSKAPPPTTTPPSTSTKTVRIDERAQVQEAPSSSTSTTHETVPDLKEVLADVGKMLKVMTASSLRKFTVKDMESTHGASIRSLTAAEEGNGPEPAGSTMATGSGTTRSSQSEESEVEEQSEGEDEGPRGILDSGASHALKQATQEEYDKGVPVKVTLAGEDTRVLRQNVCGTVLVTNDGNERIQPIVPMGALIEDLGCSLQWNRGRLKLRHPTKGFIKIYLNNNCPEVNFKEAHKLITELEKKHLAQLSSQVNSLTARLEVLRKEEKRTWDELMKDYVKTGCQATILRALLLCPVTKDLPSEVHAMLAEGFDPDGGERYLKDLPLSKRRRRALMRSSSWVIHLHAGDGDGEKGPFNVISRGGKMVLEIDAKASKQWDLHRKEGAYRMLLWAAAQGKITDVIGTTWILSDEDYNDPEKLRADQPVQASFWSTEMWKSFKSVSGMKRIDFYMGAYGHKAKRPTTAATNYPGMLHMNNNWDFSSICVPSSLLKYDEMIKWSREFKEILAQNILGCYDEAAMSEEEIKDEEATGYQHKRRKFPGMYAVAMDLAGPFKKKGRDMDFDDYKYIMVAAYRCPRQYLSSMALTELERELYVPSEDEEVPEGEDLLVLGEDDEKDLEGEESSTEEAEKLESEVEELTKKVDYATIYVTRCLRHTKTAGGDPAGNSTAELGVKWAKARVRSLLRSAGAPPEDWPMAMDHAASSLWSKAFPSSSWTNPPAVAFGTEVWFRAKAYKGKKEKKYDPDGVRWKKGLYRGPSREVSRGHLIQREDGGLVVAKGVKFNLVEPERDLQDLLPHATVQGEVEGLLDYDLPPSKRQLREEIEFVSRKAMSENNYTTEQVVEIYNLLEELGDVDFRASKKTSMTTWFTGAFVHGGKAGVRSNLKEYPMTTKFLTTFAKKFSGEKTFSALGITRNTTLGIHRDSHSSRETSNMVLPLTEFVGGNLWIQDGDADPSVAIEKELPNGKQVLGRVLNLEKNKLVEFSPSQWHEVQPWDGDRVVMLLYTPRTSKLQDEHYEELQKAGFVIDKASASTNDPTEDEEDGEAMIKRFEVNEVIEMIQAFIEVDELDFLDFNSRTRERALPRTTMKKTEVQCTPNIEEILHDLEVSGKPLEVTHTISLGDVKKNISKWYDSAVKEFTFQLAHRYDIRQAFVLAPWLGASVALQPPNIAFELGLAEPGDMWEVLMSIYGLREAPALWSGFRDQELRAAQWEATIDGNIKRLRLQQLASDNQVWKVVDMNDPDKALGYVMVYIDDLLITGPSEILHSFFAWVSARWECDELNILKEENPIRFLGLEIHKVPGGVEVAQHGFITELLRAYNHKGSRSWSQGSRDLMVLTPEEEEAILNAEPVNLEGREAEVKQAQKRVGELLWLTGRSRPDLQYITSIMSSRITRAPEIVNELGNRLLDYLYETQYYRLKFVKIDDSEQRQQLITLSTAESEMIEAVDGETQRADIGTKALPKDRLKKLVDLWGLADRRPPRVCGTVAASESIETGIAWDLYLVVAVLAIAVIGLWEGFKFCWKRKEAQLRALRAKANKASPQKLTKTELKELQRILALDPEDLTRDQRVRLVELRCACVFILYWS